MNNQNKSKEQLIADLTEMRQRVAELESARNGIGETDSRLAPGDPQWHSLVANTPVFILILDREHRIDQIGFIMMLASERGASGEGMDGCMLKRSACATVARQHRPSMAGKILTIPPILLIVTGSAGRHRAAGPADYLTPERLSAAGVYSRSFAL